MRAANRRDVPPAGPIPQEALRFWEAKDIAPGFSFEDVWAEEHLRAFTAAKFMREDVLTFTKEHLAQALSQGQTFEDFSRGLEARLREAGWWGQQEVQDPETGERQRVDVPSRLALIFETNMRTARAAGQWDRIQRTKESHPFLLYQLGPAIRHRPEHVELAGTLLPAEHPFWQSHYPPNGYLCKCWVRQVSNPEARRLDGQGVSIPEVDDKGVTTGRRIRKAVKREPPPIAGRTRQYRNKRTGRVDEVPEAVQPGFHRPPSSLRRFAAPEFVRD